MGAIPRSPRILCSSATMVVLFEKRGVDLDRFPFAVLDQTGAIEFGEDTDGLFDADRGSEATGAVLLDIASRHSIGVMFSTPLNQPCFKRRRSQHLRRQGDSTKEPARFSKMPSDDL